MMPFDVQELAQQAAQALAYYAALVGQRLWRTAVFVTVVFAAHRTLALVCQRSTFVRHLVRGKPRALVVDGKVIGAALST